MISFDASASAHSLPCYDLGVGLIDRICGLFDRTPEDAAFDKGEQLISLPTAGLRMTLWLPTTLADLDVG